MRVLKPKQARTKIIEDLENGGFVEKIEDIVHRTPISERSKTPIEIIPMEEYYLKQKDKIEKMREVGKDYLSSYNAQTDFDELVRINQY